MPCRTRAPSIAAAGPGNVTGREAGPSAVPSASRSTSRSAFACACCRRIWHLLVREDSRWAVETMERYADGLAIQAEWAAAEGRVGVLLRVCNELAPPEVRISGAAALGVWAALGAAWGEQTTAAVRGRRDRPPDRE